MVKHVSAILIAAAIGWMIAALAPAAAPGADGALQQALDRPVDLTIEDSPITEVFSRLSAKTGVKFVIDDQAIALLPYGDQTRVAMRLKNVTLRKDLSRMLAPQALQWAIEGETVRILPAEALMRLGRRASYDELTALGKIYCEKLQPAEQGGLMDQLRKITGDKDLNLTFQVGAADKSAALARADKTLGAGTAANWLDTLCQGQPWTWYLSGDEVIVLDRKEQIARQLKQIVSLRYQNERLDGIILDLTRKAHVPLEMDPGVMRYVPVEQRTNFNLIMSDATITQALEVIKGATGLEFIPTENGIRVAASENLVKASEATTQPRRSSPFFVRMNMPGPGGVNLEVFLRSDELPDDMVEAILAEKNVLLDKCARPHPATQPSMGTETQPENH